MADDKGLHEEEVEVGKEVLMKILSRYPRTFDGTLLSEFWCYTPANLSLKYFENLSKMLMMRWHNIQIHFQTTEPEKSQSASELDVSKFKVSLS